MPGVEGALIGACRRGSEGPFPVLDTLRRVTQELNNATNLDEGFTLVVRGVKEHLVTDDMTRFPSGPSGHFNGGAARPCSTAEEGKCTG
jgi:hypothetical protein